ncbi:hypothetical protein RRG08_021681 [Elysia crispata]|uniref:Uncharacterized protein n=1 Tax=Elysia crispata TaxID=231223 RepID=A0AAE0ZYY9_9GAST|nr:hypothetical protein RRG08_021681 [Elysia crispata]
MTLSSVVMQGGQLAAPSGSHFQYRDHQNLYKLQMLNLESNSREVEKWKTPSENIKGPTSEVTFFVAMRAQVITDWYWSRSQYSEIFHI